MYSFYEYYFSGYNEESLTALSMMAVLLGVTVITSKNPMNSLFFLIGLFASISLYLSLIGLTFIGFSYLIVYIGAVCILYLFILMLISIRASELYCDNFNGAPLAMYIGIFWNYSLFKSLPEPIRMDILRLFYYYITLNDRIKGNVMFISSNDWEGLFTETSHISTIGNILYTSYNIWLFLSSLILVLAMVGAIIITIKQDND